MSSEKLEAVHHPRQSRPQPSKKSRWILTAIVTVCGLIWLRSEPNWLRDPFESHHDGKANQSLPSWDRIEPSEKLSWTPCFRDAGNFYCARLTVPMDYRRPLSESPSHPKVHIALVMLPGEGHSEESGRFSESPLLINPGGPGGSGTGFALSAGSGMQAVVGRHHDIIGFDPRGIGGTSPQADCFMGSHDADDPAPIDEHNRVVRNRMIWSLQSLTAGIGNDSSSALQDMYVHAKALGKLCADKNTEDSIFKYVGTPHVAQDMLSIVDAWDEWTRSLKNKARPCMRQHAMTAPEEADADPALSTRGKLVYWGVSYGTFLGSTFAAMFRVSLADRVGRLVLDGVVDSDIYFKNAWMGSIQDADKVLDRFFSLCHSAKEDCLLYRKDDNVEDVRSRFESVMNSLKEEPKIIISKQIRLPALLPHAQLQAALFAFMYFPVMFFPALAYLVDSLHRDADLSSLMGGPAVDVMCHADQYLTQFPEDSPVATGCADWKALNKLPLSAVQKMFEELTPTSTFAGVFMRFMTRCVGWEVDVEDNPALDWDSFPTLDRAPVNTSFPILFISTTNDPITPLHQALTMTQRFGNSGLIEQLSEGHSSLSAVSLCTIGRIKAYLNEGITPPPPELYESSGQGQRTTGKWVQCKADEKPWRPFGTPERLQEARGPRAQEDVEALQSWKEVQRALKSHLFAGIEMDDGPLKNVVHMDYEQLEVVLES